MREHKFMELSRGSGGRDRCARDELTGLLEGFETVSLEDMEDVKLLRRAETKYVMDTGDLFGVLPELSRFYRVLMIEDNRINNYQTFYFDTPDLEMYRRHHNGVANRYKIRTREYVDTHLSFTEVKFKDNKKRTIKKRIKRNLEDPRMLEASKKFIGEKSPFDPDELVCVLKNNYSRITLVHKERIERLTIDLDLECSGNGEGNVRFDNLVIAEIKQERFTQKSDFVRLMHERLIRPGSFSKYCMGVSFLYDGVKKNNFKENMIFVNKVKSGVRE